MVHLGLISLLYYDHDCSSNIQSLKLWTVPLLIYLGFVPGNQNSSFFDLRIASRVGKQQSVKNANQPYCNYKAHRMSKSSSLNMLHIIIFVGNICSKNIFIKTRGQTVDTDDPFHAAEVSSYHNTRIS